MALTVTLHSIDRASYEAAVAGNVEAFEVVPDSYIELDKAWHVIHYLLTGNSELKFLNNGVVLDMAAEHMEVQSPEQVTQLHQYFQSEIPDVIVDSADWNEIKKSKLYPELDESSYEYILTYMKIFAKAVSAASAEGHGLFVIVA